MDKVNDSSDQARKISTAERVMEHLLEEVDAGRLVAGARVNAARVSQTLGISAAPVREALAVLSGRGVVDLLPDRGAVLRTFDASEVCHLFEVIGAVAELGAARAARVIAREGVPRELEAAYQAILHDAHSAQPVEFYQRLNLYHYELNRIGGNEYVTLALDRLGIAYWNRYLAGYLDVRGEMDTYLHTYTRLHDFVRAGDEDAAMAVISYHTNWSIKLIGEAASRASPQGRRRRAVRSPL